MSCTVDSRQLWSWVDRCAPQLESHLAQCEQCRRTAAEFRAEMAGVATAAQPPAVALPSRIGPFVPTRLIGEGGQAVVYEARQETPSRRVALKVMRTPVSLSGSDQRYFQREIEALGRLNHPGIAAIHQAGTTDDGRGYFAMELVDGLPLNRHAASRSLNLEEALRLFLAVCEPVSHAHQRGLIHRDLKPSNILIDATGRPRVLDFGLARPADPDTTLTFVQPAGWREEPSQAGPPRLLGTLPYMSPEQAAGVDDVDVRSDVYALGVILYELLTGELPHALSRRSEPHEALRALREDPPVRPSVRNRRLRGDMETIILKAIEKSPARRYQSVAALADDLRRFLQGEAILARPPSAAYQLRKLVARNKAPFAVAAFLALLVSAFASVATWQAIRIADQRDRAVAAAARAERIGDFLQDLLLAADPLWRPEDMTVREMLAEAERRIAQGEFGDPAVEGDLRSIVGRTWHKFGMPMRGEPHLRAALRLRERAFGPRHASVAESCYDLGMLMTSGGRYAAGQALYERALDVQRSTIGADSAEALRTAASLASLRSLTGDYLGAARDYRAIAELRRGQGPSVELAESLENLADAEAALGRLSEAERIGEQALAMRRSLFAADHVETARGLLRAACLQEKLGDMDAAEESYRASLALFEAFPDQSANQVLVLGYLGKLQLQRDRPEDALPIFSEALDRALKGFPEWHYVVLSSRRQQGECLARLGQFVEAERQLSLSLDGYRRAAGEKHPMTRAVADSLAEVRARHEGASTIGGAPGGPAAALVAGETGRNAAKTAGKQGQRP